jgi:hypothetical protein
MTLEEQLERGARAARILNDSLFSEAFESVEKAIHDRWAESPIRDIEGQQQLRLMLKLLGDVRSVLETCVSDGKHAKQEIDRKTAPQVLSPRQWAGR